MQGRVFVLGLAGPSGTGKSTVARSLAAHLDGNVLSMETYSVAVNHLSFDDRAKRNYDEPEAIDVIVPTVEVLVIFAFGTAKLG